MAKAPVRVAVTGAAGQIGYAAIFRIAAGNMLGKDQPVILQLLEHPSEKPQAALKGVMMELDDCAFPLLAGIVGTGDAKRGGAERDESRDVERADANDVEIGVIGGKAQLAGIGVGEGRLGFDAGSCKHRGRFLEDAALGNRQNQLLVRFARHDRSLR